MIELVAGRVCWRAGDQWVRWLKVQQTGHGFAPPPAAAVAAAATADELKWNGPLDFAS
ncbi:hypothetical protein UVI_02021380 [Ustilaginoidea virens]|uniref:Uncharacterized protein n=1 Tax=Ustilaginoidea virens TaxID=1159556 RepID=A0A1B5KXK9_USTVR|nr:hypothetical protein UVI_02021380 [Ustilaginoidea virens]